MNPMVFQRQLRIGLRFLSILNEQKHNTCFCIYVVFCYQHSVFIEVDYEYLFHYNVLF